MKITTIAPAVCLAVLAFYSPISVSAPEETKPEGQSANTNLGTLQVSEETLEKYSIVDGQIESVHRATMSAQTAGTIEELYFDVDDFVEKGSVIARIRAINQKSQLQQAQSGLDQAKANISEARARYKEATAEYKRKKKIFDRQLISRTQFDNAVAAKDAAQARLDAANAALNIAQETVSQAGEQLGYTEIKAPYAGLVTKRLVEIGELVNVGSPLIAGISLEKLRVTFTLSQSQVAAARENNEAKVFLGDEEIPVTKLTFFPYADPSTNAFKVRADLDAKGKALFPGMFVKIAVKIGSTTRLTVPVSAIAYRSEVTGVYVLDGQGIPRLRQVRLGRESNDGKVQILSGLDKDETIALNPAQAVVYLKQHMNSINREQ